MNPPYPTLESVEAADRVQLGRWLRHLPSPGEGAAGSDDFENAFAQEAAVMTRIIRRFAETGGWEPWISRAVGFS